MKRKHYLSVLLLFLVTSLTAQVKYDTITSKNDELGLMYFEESIVFKDFSSQASSYFREIDFSKINCFGKKVFVSTIFGKDGKIKDTKIVKSVSPICDSIAFYFIDGLTDWLPGLGGGKFVDIPYTFPITFDTTTMKDRWSKVFSVSGIEFEKRKAYFDFAYLTQTDQKIINDYRFFKKYVATMLEKNKHTLILTDYRLKRKESIKLQINFPKNKHTHLLIKDPQKDWILYDYTLNKKELRIPKEYSLLLIAYEEGNPPLLETKRIEKKSDTVLSLQLKEYTKGQLIKELKDQ